VQQNKERPGIVWIVSEDENKIKWKHVEGEEGERRNGMGTKKW
jgi:hypothetical protein